MRSVRYGDARGRRTLTTSSLVALGVAVLLASLSLVTWRQSRARESLAQLEGLQREGALARAEMAELNRRIQYLESRTRVVPEARRRLGLHVPSDDEIVHLRGEQP